MTHASDSRALLLALGSVTFGGLAAALGKHTAPLTGVPLIVTAQFAVCGLLVLPLMRGHWQRPTPRALALHGLRGVSGFICFFSFYLALQHIPLAHGVLLRNAAPIWLPLLGLATGLRPGPRSLTAIAVGFVGVTVLLRPQPGGLSLWHGVGWLSGVAFAVSMLTIRVLARHEPQPRILVGYFLLALLFSLPVTLWQWQPVPLTALPWLLGIGLGMYLALRCFTLAYSLVPAHRIAPTVYVGVILSGMIDAIVWGYRPDTAGLLGVGLIALALFWSRPSRRS